MATRVSLLALLLLGASCAPKPPLMAHSRPSSFFVAPYLVAPDRGAPAVRWWPVEGGGAPSLSLLSAGGARELPAERRGSLYSVRLPLSCTSGEQRLRYRVPGMTAPAPLTLPPCPSAPRARFVLLSDTQRDTEMIALAARWIADFAPDFVLHGGDLVNRGSSPQHWIDYFHAVAPFGRSTATIATLGNHELYFSDGLLSFQRYFYRGPTWFHFAAGPVDVVVLDSERIDDEAVHRRQRRWLEQTLARLAAAPQRDRRWLLVLTHHAPLSSGLANSDWVPIGRSRALKERYLPLLERYGVDLVLAGHTHVYERLEQNGVHYVVGGTVGGLMGLLGSTHPRSRAVKQARTVSTFEASAGALQMRTVELKGGVIDELHLTRDAPLAAAP